MERQNVSDQKQIDNLYGNIKTLKEKQIEDKEKEYVEKLQLLKVQIEEKEQEITVLKKEQDEITQWEVYFGRFRNYLINHSLKIIEGYVNLYLKKIQTELQVVINGYRELKTGKTKEEIEILVMKNGTLTGKFNKLSGGERLRVDIAGILTFQKLINLNSSGKGLDLLFMDEIIEAADISGVNEILKMLNVVDQTIVVVTHNTQGIVYENKKRIVKENGNSIIYN